MKTTLSRQDTQSEPKEPPAEFGTVRVLTLDDDELDITAMRRCLRKIEDMSIELTGCTDLESALEVVEQGTFDVLFVDYFIAGMTGLEALEVLRAAGFQAPAVLLTSSHGERILHEALRAGVMDYVPKDRLNPDLLGQTIRSVLAKAELNARIERKQQQLEETIKCLKQRSQEIESFYHNVSHELRTPLAGAREFVALVQDGVAGPLTEPQAKLLAAAVRNCDQMTHCVNDMLDAARIETGKLILTKKPSDLVAVTQDALESMRSTAVDKEITIELHGLEDPMPFTFDPHRIYQVAANLISNALKFTPRGGRISVEVEELPGGICLVRVSDSGPGIPGGDEARIFDRLYQSHASDAATLGGLGMGLYISREIIELHEGTISCARSPLGGAEFTFTLPTNSLPVNAPEKSADADASSTLPK